jgi:hypothetical protein
MDQRKVKTYSKKGGFNSKAEVLSVLIKMGLRLNVDYVLLIDSSYFFQRTMLEENQMAEELTQAFEEVKKYDQTLIILDVDSVWEVNKQYSSQSKSLAFANPLAMSLDNNEINFTETIVRHTLMQICLNYAEAFLESPSNHWIIFISSNTKIVMEFKEKLNWPKTDYELDLEDQIEEQLMEKQCVNCREIYSEKDNKLGKCGTHTSDSLYLESDYNCKFQVFSKTIENTKIFDHNGYTNILQSCKHYSQNDIQKMINEKKINSSQAKWMCCGKTFYEKGEQPSFHTDK